MIDGRISIHEVAARYNVSRETSGALQIYHGLLKKWNPAINLVSKASMEHAVLRHFADSLQLWQYRAKAGMPCSNWIDMGSGAGFPGLVLAIVARDLLPGCKFHLIESDARKCAFLRNVSRETKTPVTVYNQRVEHFDGIKGDIVSARALAPVSKLLGYSGKISNPDAIYLYLKGKTCHSEIQEASRFWTFDVEHFASDTDDNGTVLRVKNLACID